VAIDFGNCGILEVFAELVPGTVGEADRKRARENRLGLCVKWGRMAEGRALIAAGVDVNAPNAHERQTPLAQALQSCRIDFVKILLAAGADPSLPARKRVRPVLLAAEERQWEAAILLVRAGADPDVLDHQGRSIWTFARDCPGAVETLQRGGLTPPAQTPARRPRPIERKPLGRYREPASLRALRGLRDRCAKDGLDFELIGLRLPNGEDYRYPDTPPDLLPFACTGGDGIHFGVLTDFGTARALDRAPIVCVSPTNDPAVTLVAANIKEFLAVVCRLGDAEALDGMPTGLAEEKGWLADLRASKMDDDRSVRKACSAVIARVRRPSSYPASAVWSSRRWLSARPGTPGWSSPPGTAWGSCRSGGPGPRRCPRSTRAIPRSFTTTAAWSG
jgi:hypothetical protein